LKKIPRQIRRQLERKLKNAEADLIKRWGLIRIDHKDPTDHSKENKMPMIDMKTWDPAWMTEKGGEWVDPVTKEKKNIRVSELKTFGRMDDKTQAIRVSRKKYTKFVQECAELLDELDPAGLASQEALGDWGGDEILGSPSYWNTVANNGSGAANGKYLPYQPGPYTRQIYIQDQWVMLSRAAELVNYNPLAKAGIYIKSAFTIGKGPKILISPPDPGDQGVPANGEAIENKAQKAWDNYNERVKHGTKLCNRDRMLSTNGEFFQEY
jgi:hypothetical protein